MHQRKIIFVKLKVSTNRFERNSREIKFCQIQLHWLRFILRGSDGDTILFICNCWSSNLINTLFCWLESSLVFWFPGVVLAAAAALLTPGSRCPPPRCPPPPPSRQTKTSATRGSCSARPGSTKTHGTSQTCHFLCKTLRCRQHYQLSGGKRTDCPHRILIRRLQMSRDLQRFGKLLPSHHSGETRWEARGKIQLHAIWRNDLRVNSALFQVFRRHQSSQTAQRLILQRSFSELRRPRRPLRH